MAGRKKDTHDVGPLSEESVKATVIKPVREQYLDRDVNSETAEGLARLARTALRYKKDHMQDSVLMEFMPGVRVHVGMTSTVSSLVSSVLSELAAKKEPVGGRKV